MFARLIFATCMGWLLLSESAFAANELFTVRNVPVDATAEGSAQARDVALAVGQRAAFRRLMQRLTRRQDWNALPEVSAEQLGNFVLGFEVAEEQSSSTRYIAKVTYNFKPPPVRNLLRQSGIGFSEARAKTALLLPVFETGGQTQLWEEGNPWRAAWAKQNLGDDLVPLMLPLSDLEDSNLVSAATAKTANWSAVSAIAQKYGLERVVVATAVAAPGGVSVRLRQLSDGQDASAQVNASGADLSAQLDHAVENALSRLYDEWKTATIVTFGQENELLASITYNSLQEWLTIRRRLDEASTITGIDVLAMSTLGAEVRLRYAGTTDQLRITLEQLSLRISNVDSLWQIVLSGSVPVGTAGATTSFGRSMIPSSGSSGDSSTAPLSGRVDPGLVTKIPNQ